MQYEFESCGHTQEVHSRIAVRVEGVIVAVVDRIPKASLSEHLERGAGHPAVDVDGLPAFLVHAFLDASTQLHTQSKSVLISNEAVAGAGTVRDEPCL